MRHVWFAACCNCAANKTTCLLTHCLCAKACCHPLGHHVITLITWLMALIREVVFFLWVQENLTAHSFKCFHHVYRRSTALLCTDITQGTRLMKQVFSVIKCWWSPANPIPRVLHETGLLHTEQVSRLCCGWRCEILARFKGNPLIKAVCIRSVPPDCLQITQSWAIFIRHAYFLGEWTR